MTASVARRRRSPALSTAFATRMRGVVGETVQPAHVPLWLRDR